MDDSAAVFYIGQHEKKRTLDVSAELLQHAQDLGVNSLFVIFEYDADSA